ncbi:MAG: hypothetical protein M3Q15_06025 [Pseudomonadota bacterium]|nr:hypothetical protein [Pseudomonadota bacterium]
MFQFDRTDLQRMGVAAIGAIILSTTFVGAAVAPARAVETGPSIYAHAAATGEARA